MIPILYDKAETDFYTNGLGGLPDCISCVVTTEANSYELEMQYPMDGLHFDLLSPEMIIKVKPDAKKEPQLFQIYHITKPINGIVTINAEHISYRMNYAPVMPFTASSCSSALQRIKGNEAFPTPFSFETNVTARTKAMSPNVPKSMRELLMGNDESLVNKYGVELDFDNFTVRARAELGEHTDFKIAYGVNLVDLKQEENIANTVCGICPYAYDDTVGLDVNIKYGQKYVTKDGVSMASMRIVPVDVSEIIGKGVKVTDANLRSAAQTYIDTHKIGVPEVSIEIDFVNLGDSEEYAELKNLYSVALYDTVSVQFVKLGIDTSARISKTEWDVLTDKYIKVTVGAVTKTIADTIAIQQQEVPTSATVQDMIQQSADKIAGNSGGYVVLNPTYKPEELLIMDNPDKTQATNVWRFNQQGLAHGKNYSMQGANIAITMDGKINGEMVRANSITGTQIAANSIYGDHIVANAIGADKIKANAITSTHISANSIYADMIRANAITSEKIAANSIYADMIRAGAVTVDKINADSVIARMLQTGTSSGDGWKIDKENITKSGTINGKNYEVSMCLNTHRALAFMIVEKGTGNIPFGVSPSGHVQILGGLVVDNGLDTDKINGKKLIFSSDGIVRWQ